MKNLFRYRKITLIVSVFLFILFLLHLIGSYIYKDGKFIGVSGGSVSVGVTSDRIPDVMNPLKYGTEALDDLIFNMMFRSLVTYNSTNGIFEGDLANCDITDLQKINCQLRDDAMWSDATNITVDDISATFSAFADITKSKSLKSAFRNLKVVKKDDKNFSIESKILNNRMVEAISFPIFRTDMVDQIRNQRLKKSAYIVSGPFIFDSSEKDSEYGFHKISLIKNPNYPKNVWLDRFNFKIFANIPALERAIETTHVVLLPSNRDNIKTPTLFRPVNFHNYEFYGIFFNTNVLDKNLRNIVHNILAKKFEESPIKAAGHIGTLRFFDGAENISGVTPAMNIEQFMNDKGYQKKSVMIANIAARPTTLKNVEIPNAKYFRNGGGKIILFSNDPKEEITLFGRVPNTTESISVNGYFLQEYNAGNTDFVYKISKDAGTLKNGKNVYQLNLRQKDGTELSEMLTIYHSLDENELNAYHENVNKNLLETLNTPQNIADRENAKNQEISKLQGLADNLYYNENLEPFQLTVAFMSDKQISQDAMKNIEDSLGHLGVHLNAKALSAKEIEAMIKAGKRDYDLIVVGIRSPGTISHMGEAFFSSVNNNPNFSNLSSKNLESLFLELQKIGDEEKMKALQGKITQFMNEQSFFLPISKPQKTLYIDRNIKGFILPKNIGSIADLAPSFYNLSIKDYYKTDTTGKSIFGFFSWIWNSVFQKSTSSTPSVGKSK